MNKKNPTQREALFPGADSQSKIIAIHMSAQSRRIYVRSRRRTFAIFLILLSIPWMVLVFYLARNFMKVAPVVSAEHPGVALKPGPWGNLQAYDFITDPPAEFINDELFPPRSAEWFFPTVSREVLNATVTASGMPKEPLARVLASAELLPNQGWLLHPSDNDLLELSPDVRKTLYAELAKTPLNQRQLDPFIFDPVKLDQWLSESSLAPDIVAKLKKLLYPHGKSVLFADANNLMKFVPERADRYKLLNILLRRSTVMLKLSPGNLDDLPALSEYWSVGGRQKEVRPLLDSLHRNCGGMALDVALLLPPFARNRLYMYPPQNFDAVSMRRDCHWTALNFFNDLPDDAFTDGLKTKATLDSKYTDVEGAPKFGDIATLSTSDGRTVHSCVYIADDLYFSKNGPSYISPWVIMPLEDIKSLFPIYDPLIIHHHRLKKSSN